MIGNPEVLAKKLGLRFRDRDLLRQALTHRSALGPDNERLEFLGDAILGFLVAERLFQRFPAADEGNLTRLRASLVNQRTLARLAVGMQLGDYLILGAGELKSGGYRRESILSDALEAILAALYFDQGMDACRDWVERLFDQEFASLSLAQGEKDPKTRLQEWLQGRSMALPEYMLLSTEGPSHNPVFRVECRVPALAEPSRACASSRRGAEQEAARDILRRLQEESE